VADDDDAGEVEVVGGGELGQDVGGVADVLIGAGPAAAGVSVAAVFDVPRGDALLGEGGG